MSLSPDDDSTDTISAFNSRSEELSRMVQQGRSWSGHERNCAFLNLGDRNQKGKQYANISSVTGFDFDDDARGICVLDWDHDGDLDLWVRNRNAPNLRLLRNEGGSSAGNFLRLQLFGDGSTTNRNAIGARVEVTLSNSSRPIVRTIRAGDGFLTQSSKILHFGLGADPDAEVEKLVIRWPDRGRTKEEFVSGFECNRIYQIEQGKPLKQLEQRTPPGLSPLPVELPNDESSVRVYAQSYFPLPAVRYIAPDGTRIERKLISDRWTLLNLWATWCAPCLAELRGFANRENELKEAGIDVLALSVDLPNEYSLESPLAITVGEILERIQFPFASGFAEAGLISNLQAINDNMTSINRDLPVPCSFLINPRGKVIAIYKGVVSVDQVLTDAAKVNVPIHERLQNAMTLGGSLVPSEIIRKAELSTEAGFQFYIGRELVSVSPAVATSHFAEALQIRPDFVEPRIHLGIALNKLNELEAAKQQLKLALAQDPGNEEKGAAYFQLSEIALREGKLDEAIPLLESTLSYAPDQTYALNNLAFLLSSKHAVDSSEFGRAVKMAERAVEATQETHPDFLDTLGGIYRKAERFDEALTTFEKALQVAEEQENDTLAGKLRSKIQDYR